VPERAQIGHRAGVILHSLEGKREQRGGTCDLEPLMLHKKLHVDTEWLVRDGAPVGLS
jgi:hypothetical protein